MGPALRGRKIAHTQKTAIYSCEMPTTRNASNSSKGSKTSKKSSKSKVKVKTPRRQRSKTRNFEIAGETRLAPLVASGKKPVSLKNAKTWRQQFLGQKEAWEVTLLHALVDPSVAFAPPSIHSEEVPNAALASFNYLNPLSDSFFQFTTTPSNILINIQQAEAPPILTGSKLRRMNYQQSSSTAQATIPLQTGTAMWVWADPYDPMTPIKTSQGPLTPPGGTIYGPWTCGLSAIDGNAAGVWSNNFASTYQNFPWNTTNPLMQPTNWTQGRWDGVSGQYPTAEWYGLYPPVFNAQSVGVPITTGVSNLYYCQNLKLQVATEDSTAFSAVSMLTRHVERQSNRFFNRIDNPLTGSYGNCDNFTACYNAVALWSADVWECSRFAARPAGSDDSIPVPLPNQGNAQNGTDQYNGSIYQWGNLNYAIQAGFPIIQIQCAGNPGNVVNFAITLDVQMASTPLWAGPGNCGLTDLSVPFTIPDWFSAARGHGLLIPPKTPLSAPVMQLAARAPVAIANHPGDTPLMARMQSASRLSSGNLQRHNELTRRRLGTYNDTNTVYAPSARSTRSGRRSFQGGGFVDDLVDVASNVGSAISSGRSLWQAASAIADMVEFGSLAEIIPAAGAVGSAVASVLGGF